MAALLISGLCSLFQVYGKLALKFEHFFKRWLQIFYPREISTSLEEKNRRLMKMLVNRNNPGGGGDEDENEDESGNRSGAETRHDELGENGGLGGGDMNNENEMNGEGNNENRALVFDLNGSALKKKKRRAPDPDRDKYIQEPQYVTKRTSSGRLVKMKIITDYDYTSDQEQEAAKKKRSKLRPVFGG